MQKAPEFPGAFFLRFTKENLMEQLTEQMHKAHTLNARGIVYRIKSFKDFSFLHVYVNSTLIQMVLEGPLPKGLQEQSAIAFMGIFQEASIKDVLITPKHLELKISQLRVLSSPTKTFPFDITKKELNINNDVLFDLRPMSMRHPKVKAIFKIQEAITIGFRNYLQKNHFTEIRTPKIVKAGAEGGANIFELNYFGEKAYLAQSPQFYKEFCCGVFQKVFEIAPVFRAEKHNTTRHLNEYTSMDVEMGPIENFSELMDLEECVLKEVISTIKERCGTELALLEVVMPEITIIPRIKFSEVKKIMVQNFGIKEPDSTDLSPEEEVKLCEHIKKSTGSEFVFVTHYPSSKRPFYAMDSQDNPLETESFDLLFRGVEITTGGQRIHQYEVIKEKMLKRNMLLADFEFFTDVHQFGLPPHGGFGLGLERLTQKLIGLDNIKEATMFPRDVTRLFP